MGELKDVLVVNKDKKVVPRIPRVGKAKGNVPTSEEFNALVGVVNQVNAQLIERGLLK